jgi:ElaB/YqjD/DUF883 family membrane-anchored ribosome-binding protein
MSDSVNERSATEASGGGMRDPEEIRAEIEQTRQELGETVAAVAERADVKHQAQAKADELKDQVSGKAKELRERAREVTPDSAGKGIEQAQQVARQNPMLLTLAATFLGGFVLGRLMSR